MSAGELGARIDEAWQRLQEVSHPGVGETVERSRFVDQLVLDLTTSLEELRVADEELRAQNAELAENAEALAQERARYLSLFEHAPEPYLVTDAQGVLLEANAAAVAFLGVQAQFLVGRPLSVYVAADDHRRFFDFLARLGQEAQPHTDDLHFLPRGGRPVPVSITVAANPDPGCGALIYRWLVRDITARKSLEQALASERDRLDLLVTERTVALRGLASHLLLLEEAERRRLAVELHDSLGQNLAAIRLKLSEAEVEPGTASCGRVLHDIDPLLAQVIDAARTITRDLSPPTLHTFGLAAALDELCGEFSTRFGLTVIFRDDGGLTPGSLPLPTGILFFRSVRELLVNVGKHAGVTTASVSMTRIEDDIVVTVEDEGIGFDPADVAACASRGECFGLFTIAERLTNSGGRFEVDSAPGRGTRITMVAPVHRPDSLSFNPLP